MPRKANSSQSVSVAFCFDHNMWMLAGVAIASLLYHGVGKCRYEIYCVVPADFSTAKREEMQDMVASLDSNSSITFLDANHDFDASVTHQYTTGIYYRFMLAKLLPNVDKIIYCDADVSFCQDLCELYNMDMGDNLIAGVRDAGQGRPYPSAKNGYVNSGILVMNLREIRRKKLYNEWLRLSKSDEFAYPDQDILNKTCDGKIMYLPLKYNYMCGAGGRFGPAIKSGIYTEAEVSDAEKNPVIIHYILRQPWLGRANLVGDLWWRYAAMTPFYDSFLARLRQAPDIVVKRILLFNFLNIMTVKVRQNLVKYYLCGFIPLFKVKSTPK